MSATLQRSSKSAGRQSLFYRDLASPISANRGGGRFATPGQAAAVSALWRENFAAAAADPPPPPVFTLDDRADFSPEPGLGELPPPPSPSTPTPARGSSFSSPSPFKTRAEEGSAGTVNGGPHVSQLQLQQSTPGSSSWWSPVVRNGGSGGDHREEKGKGSPVDGVVQPGALIMLPPPREVARPDMQRNSLPMGGGLDEEEWVTVYGFSPADTNLVLREFEKCGIILKHVPGPRDANWMHILYQNRYDAQKALRKDGMQINSVLIIGVKPVDPAQRQFLNERLNSNSHRGFMVSLPPKSSAGRSSAAMSPLVNTPRPNYLLATSSAAAAATTTTTSDSKHRPTGAIASPAKSVISKVMDLMFGI